MESFKAMFGFIFSQPIHVTLRQMRIVQVLLIFSSQALLWEIVRSLKDLDPTQSAIAYGAIAAALITNVWQGLRHITCKAEKDD